MYIPGFEGDIEKNPELLLAHSRDASVFEITPSAVLYPKNADDISRAILYARAQKMPISIRAGGTCMTGGSLTSGLMLNMTRYMTDVGIDPHVQTAKVSMGAMFRDVESVAASHKLMFAPYPSSHLICGIGGMIGNNASGEKSIRCGATVDNVVNLEAVLADGAMLSARPVLIADLRAGNTDLEGASLRMHVEALRLYEKYGPRLAAIFGRVKKVSAGYRLDRIVNEKEGTINLTPLFIGAQGTLGIVTKATLALAPIPTSTRLLLVSVDRLAELPFILKTILAHNPEGVETFDLHTFARAKISMPSETELLAPVFARGCRLVVLAQFSEDTQAATDAQARMCAEALSVHPVSVTYVEDVNLASAAWKIRRASYAVMRQQDSDSLQPVPCIEDIIVPIDRFAELVPRLERILAAYRVSYGFHGHIGDGALRVIPIIDLADQSAAATIVHLSRDVFELVRELGGSMSGDHSDGIIRSPFLYELYGQDIFECFREIKKLFDPENILNPEKKTGSREENIARYLRRDWRV